jgi:hypothetical protein
MHSTPNKDCCVVGVKLGALENSPNAATGWAAGRDGAAVVVGAEEVKSPNSVDGGATLTRDEGRLRGGGGGAGFAGPAVDMRSGARRQP